MSDLELAQEHYFAQALENPRGALCPCCLRPGKAHPRTINPDQAYFLVRFWQEYGQEWGSMQDLRRKYAGLDGREDSKLRYWKLFEPKGGKSRAQEWRVKDFGVAFILEETDAPKVAHILANNVIGYSEETLGIRNILSKKYDYDLLNI
jgi:hypothetical protein